MNRNLITFSANEQTLIKTGGINNYASNTVSYIVAEFDLGENWDEFDSVRAIFQSDFKTAPAVLAHGSCVVPFEVLRYRSTVRVNLVGSVAEQGVLIDRLTTFPITALNVTADALVDNSIAPISPSEFEEFVAMVRDDADRAEAGAESAESSASAASTSAQSAEDSALSASNSASDASASAQTAQEEAQKITGMVVVVTQLPEGATPTSDWSDGVLTIGIPKGDTGETGATGNGIESAVLNADYTLTLTFTDGTSYTTPSIRGATGATGATGNGISSVTLTSTSGAVKTYTIAFTDGTNTTFDVTDGEVTQAVLDEEITALKSDISDNGVVAGSNGLVSDAKISDSVPYLYRQTADGQRVGNVLYEEIVGGTVAFNQLANTNQSITNTNTDTRSTLQLMFRNGTSTSSASFFAQNISATGYFNKMVAPQSNGTGWSLVHNGSTRNLTFMSTTNNPPIAGHKYLLTMYFAGVDVNTVGGVILNNLMLIDLTQMFGSTIADYIYSLEQANAGAGVAWFKKLFPKPYYEYNAGELKSVEGLTEHVTTGKNQLNVSIFKDQVAWNSGELKLLPNTQYTISSNCNGDIIYLYVAGVGQTFNPATEVYSGHSVTATTDGNGILWYQQRVPNLSAGSVNDYWYQLEYGTTATAYEPYHKRTYALDSAKTYRGVFKLDDSGRIYADGDIYASDGTITRRYRYFTVDDADAVNVGTSSSGVNYADLTFGSAYAAIYNSRCICNGYTWVSQATTGASGLIKVYNNALTIYDSRFTSASVARQVLTDAGFGCVYNLATPTTETAQPYTSPQIVDRLGTEEYVTTGIVPVGHNSKYSEDLKGKIESLPWDFSTLIAPTETAYKATRNYTTGSLLIVNNTLYKVTANIANGANITPNTNCTATTLSEVIASL